MNPDGSDKRRAYRSGRVFTNGCGCENFAPPIWSPDGKQIAFSADAAGGYPVYGTYVINADGKGTPLYLGLTTTELAWQRIP
jgi:Tol biopolymer transport system component